MEASSPVISENLSTEDLSKDGDQIHSWSPGSLSQAVDVFQQIWFDKNFYALPPFCVMSKVLSKVLQGKVPITILVTHAWPSQLWYPEAMRMSILQPILLIWSRDLLKSPKGEIHLFVQNETLKLDGLRARLQKERALRKASSLIIKSRR